MDGFEAGPLGSWTKIGRKGNRNDGLAGKATTESRIEQHRYACTHLAVEVEDVLHSPGRGRTCDGRGRGDFGRDEGA